MATIPQITDRLEIATERAENASSIMHDVANGDATTSVPTESGPTPSIKKWFDGQRDVLYEYVDGLVGELGGHSLMVFETFSEAQAAIPTLLEGALVAVFVDETRGSSRTMYKIQASALVYLFTLGTSLTGSDLAAVSNWASVPQIADGGILSDVNAQGSALANRTEFLYNRSAPLDDYVQLREYTGSAERVSITKPGVAGFFTQDLSGMKGPDNGGTIIVDALGRTWERLYRKSAVQLSWFIPYDSCTTDVAFNTAPYLIAAINAAAGVYESSGAVIVEPGSYSFTTTAAVNLANCPGHISIICNSKATFIANQPDGHFLLDVDFSTGGTANFIAFNMKGIAISDAFYPARGTKHGIFARRLIGSRFVGCEFNYLARALDLNDDSNLNNFDSCQFRANANGFLSSQGVANNNIFLNCQWRYHTGTAFDSRGTDGNAIIGGDFEPYNASPVIIADSLNISGLRFERNVANEEVGVRVLNNSRIDISTHADGATQASPVIDVIGDSNVIKVSGIAADAVRLSAGATRNTVHVPRFVTLRSTVAYIVQDLSGNSTNIIHGAGDGSMQAGSLQLFAEAAADELVSQDLTTWTATGCEVAKTGSVYRVTCSVPGATLSIPLPNTNASFLGIGLTYSPVNPSGGFTVSLTGIGGLSLDNAVGVTRRAVMCTGNVAAAERSIVLTFIGGDGAACDIAYVRTNRGSNRSAAIPN